MRGKGKRYQEFQGLRGITPAYAGKRGLVSSECSSQRDHPCVCGEKFAGVKPHVHRVGSPLRMRGKDLELGVLHGRVRITPAYAGKSLTDSGKVSCKWDHPCVCGEKLSIHCIDTTSPGSPLRMRGKGVILLLRQKSYRITPAYAGKRGVLHGRVILERDHPCVCGEKLVTALGGIAREGSPLRMRGKALLTT